MKSHTTEEKSKLPRREREKNAKRKEIFLAARRIFAEKGFQRATLDEIAQAAEFAKGTIYNYFTSKHELFQGILDSIFDEALDNARNAIAVSGNVRERVSAYTRAMMTLYSTNSDLFLIFMREMDRIEFGAYDRSMKKMRSRIQELSQILASALQKDIPAKTLKSFEPTRLAVVFNGMIGSFCRHNFNESRSIEINQIEDAVKFLTTIFFDGISNV